MIVNAKQFSRAIHALGLSNKDAVPGFLHYSGKGGVKHTAFPDDKGVYYGDIIFDGINPPAHYLRDDLIHLID